MRIAVAGCSHETNTFSPNETTEEMFLSRGCLRGQEIIDRFGYARHMITGFVEAAAEKDFDLVPLVHYRQPPAGIITRAAAARIVDDIVAALKAEGPFDAVLMAQHGASVSALDHDFDGYLLRKVREAVGPIPVGACFDLHANVSRAVVDAVDVAVYYRTNPHVDARERGLDCGRIIADLARERFPVSTSFVKLPMAIVISHQDSAEEPLRGIYAEIEAACADPRVLTFGLVEGYQYADVAAMGVSLYCATRDDPALAEDLTRRIAERVWAAREALNAMPRPPEGVFSDHRGESGPPLGILDIGDNIGGGSTGDSTVLLHLVRVEQAEDVWSSLQDPEAVAACVAAGEGARVRLMVGGKIPGTPAPPFELEGVVTRISDGRFEDRGPTHGGYRHFDSGTTAVVEAERGLTVVLTSKIMGNTSAAQMTALGIDPATKRFLILRGVNSPRASYAPVVRAFLPVDTPGLTMADYRRFDYRHRPRPLYPLEPDTAWSPGG